jgi:hypothetical protein
MEGAFFTSLDRLVAFVPHSYCGIQIRLGVYRMLEEDKRKYVVIRKNMSTVPTNSKGERTLDWESNIIF